MSRQEWFYLPISFLIYLLSREIGLFMVYERLYMNLKRMMICLHGPKPIRYGRGMKRRRGKIFAALWQLSRL